MSKKINEGYPYTQNRELSWLAFNKRVLNQADDEKLYPLERLKFIAIFSSNLDEFFRIRVGSLCDIEAMYPKDFDNKSGLSPKQQIELIFKNVSSLIVLKKSVYSKVLSTLEPYDIKDSTYSELSNEEKSYVKKYYKNKIFPLLSPIIIGPHHPLPHLVNKQLYVITLLKDKKNNLSIGIVPVLETLPSYLRLENSNHYIRMENIILNRASSIFGDNYQVIEKCIISATRNGDISLDDEKFEDSDIDIRNVFYKVLKRRDYLKVVRLEINNDISDVFLNKLMAITNTSRQQIIFDTCPLNMSYVFKLIDEFNSLTNLTYPPYTPVWPKDINKSKSIIEQVIQKDRLLFFPFDSVNPFISLLNEAANRDDVLSIKITIYRLASSSKIARILCRAAENGKKVLVLMELRARFDENNNLNWSKQLEEAGCQVIYGIEGYKCHSKICLITLNKYGKTQNIVQVGTGNYNEKTNAMYTDLSYFTSNKDIVEDATSFFRNMMINDLSGKYNKLCVSPFGIKNMLIKRIDEEMLKGEDGYICIKANSLTEKEVIDKLIEASNVGVKVELIIRGICCLIPGIVSYSENIHVTSIIGRYLEHARIYRFGKDNPAYYISSADIMSRNLNRRVEIACPIEDKDICDMLEKILSIQLADNLKATTLLPDGSYIYKQTNNAPLSSQDYFMENHLHNEIKESKKDSFISVIKSLFVSKYKGE